MSQALPIGAILLAFSVVLVGSLLVFPYIHSHNVFRLMIKIGGYYMKYTTTYDSSMQLSAEARAFNVVISAIVPKYELLSAYREHVMQVIQHLAYPLNQPKYETKYLSDIRSSIYTRDLSCTHLFNENKTVLLYAHGGGYTAGHPLLGSMIYKQLTDHVRPCMDFLGVNYALCPEYTIDDAIYDMETAFQYLIEHGYKSITMLGDNAGGGLTLLTIADKIKEYHGHINAVVLVSPWLDLTRSTNSYYELGSSDILFNEGAERLYMESILQMHSEEELNGYSIFTRIKNGEVIKLPKIFLVYSSTERVRDECEQFFAMISEQDDRHKVEVGEGLPHIFSMFVPFIPEAVETVNHIAEFIQE